MNKIITYYTLAFKNFAKFSGRSSRAEYWYFYLANFLIVIGLSIFSSVIDDKNAILSSIYNLVVFIPSLALSIRRLHDIDKSGWMLLVLFIPVIGVIWTLVLMATAGKTEDNKFGAAPKMQTDQPDVSPNPVPTQTSTPEVSNTTNPPQNTQV